MSVVPRSFRTGFVHAHAGADWVQRGKDRVTACRYRLSGKAYARMADVTSLDTDLADSALLRKGRGAFFTPPSLCRYVAEWAIRQPDDQVLEPSCGEAAFLLAATERLEKLRASSGRPAEPAQVHGVELHERSARQAAAAVRAAGYDAEIEIADFFTLEPRPVFDAVVGNPPYIRYQDFVGEPRARSRAAALRAGVALTNLASSWAAFAVHAALFLKPSGRLGLVLPAELLTVNYAAPVRRFLMERFASIRMVLFTERVFPGVLEEIVLLLADGFGQGPAPCCQVSQARDIDHLDRTQTRLWKPDSLDGKWTPALIPPKALDVYERLLASARYTTLGEWGDTTLGMVTGGNRYFALSPAEAREHGIGGGELLPLSPPGSRHLRGISFTERAHRTLGAQGRATRLFRPPGDPSLAASTYIARGEAAGVHGAYKCRVRSPWWRVPLVAPADLLLTYMNADTPRLCANTARVYHLNSVHGVYLRPGTATTGGDLLPVAALSSMTLLAAETVGRAYGGGMLKIEPREADRLPVPALDVAESARASLTAAVPEIMTALQAGKLTVAAKIVDEVLLVRHLGLARPEVAALREAHAELHARRIARGANRRIAPGDRAGTATVQDGTAHKDGSRA